MHLVTIFHRLEAREEALCELKAVDEALSEGKYRQIAFGFYFYYQAKHFRLEYLTD